MILQRSSNLQLRGALESKGTPKKEVLKTVCLSRTAGHPLGFLPQNGDWPPRVRDSGFLALYLIQSIAVTSSAGTEGVFGESPLGGTIGTSAEPRSAL
jgi:hypothetical protein